MNVFLMLGLAFGFIILAMIFMGVWTYKDASSRGLNAPLWTLVVILIPNLIGLLLYFIVGRNSVSGRCANCNSTIDKSSVYCKECGQRLDVINPIKSKSLKKYLIGFVASILLAILCFVSFVVFAMMDDNPCNLADGLSILKVETNIGDRWNIACYKTNKIEYKEIKINSDSPKLLFVKGNCEEGNLTLTIKQGDKVETIDLTNTPDYKKIDLSKFNEGTVELKLDATNATSSEFKSYWE
jgi:hypothetical protein